MLLVAMGNAFRHQSASLGKMSLALIPKPWSECWHLLLCPCAYGEYCPNETDEREIANKVQIAYRTSSSAPNLNMISLLLVFQTLLRRDKSDVSLLTIEQPSDILQSQTASLGVLEPDAEDHSDQHGEEHEVVLPLDGIKRDRVDEGVEERENERGHLDEGEALGAQLIGPNLDGVGDDERSEGDVVAEEVAVR